MYRALHMQSGLFILVTPTGPSRLQRTRLSVRNACRDSHYEDLRVRGNRLWININIDILYVYAETQALIRPWSVGRFDGTLTEVRSLAVQKSTWISWH